MNTFGNWICETLNVSELSLLDIIQIILIRIAMPIGIITFTIIYIPEILILSMSFFLIIALSMIVSEMLSNTIIFKKKKED